VLALTPLVGARFLSINFNKQSSFGRAFILAAALY
jgi:hypothetical protein